MHLNGVMGLGVGDWMGGGYERHTRQYFTYRVKHNKGIFIKYLTAHRLLDITDNIGHSWWKNSIKKKEPLQLSHYKNILYNELCCMLSPLPKSTMHLIGEASRLIAVEINLESNYHHKQNLHFCFIRVSRSSVCCAMSLLRWAQEKNPICFKLATNLDVLKCLDEKWVSHAQLLKKYLKNKKCLRCSTCNYSWLYKMYILYDITSLYLW